MLEDIRKRLERYKELYKGTDGFCDVEDFSDDVATLLSLIDKYREALSRIENIYTYDFPDYTDECVDIAYKALKD